MGNRHSCEQDSLEIVTEEMSLEGGLQRESVVECLRQTVSESWDSISPNFITDPQWPHWHGVPG